MSITTKSHLAEDQLVKQQENLQGIGDLVKEFGERNHQYQWIEISDVSAILRLKRQSSQKKKFTPRIKRCKTRSSQSRGSGKGVSPKELKRARQQIGRVDWMLEKQSWLCLHHRLK
jgi:hypothetical protein